jgi:hypothetical protein
MEEESDTEVYPHVFWFYTRPWIISGPFFYWPYVKEEIHG